MVENPQGLATISNEGDATVASGAVELAPELNIRFHMGIAELSGS